jgi:hypothetical protein
LKRRVEKEKKVEEQSLRTPHQRLCLAVCVIVPFISTGAATADWEVGDPATFYQLPDPTGWDVYSEWCSGVANDWTASETAPITDIHFWGSWKNDMIGEIGEVLIQIFDNDVSGSFARPGNQIWECVFSNDDSNPNNDYTSRLLYPEGDLGWYDPRGINDWHINDHVEMYQCSIPNINNPFTQEAGHTYWLMISTHCEGGEWGWKTSTDVVGNSSVFWDTFGYWGGNYQQLKQPYGYSDPRTPLDVAFVLTIPEPATLLLFAFSGLFLKRRR